MKRIGEILVEANLITAEHLQNALQIQKKSEEKQLLGEVLIDMGVLTYDALLDYLSLQIENT